MPCPQLQECDHVTPRLDFYFSNTWVLRIELRTQFCVLACLLLSHLYSPLLFFLSKLLFYEISPSMIYQGLRFFLKVGQQVAVTDEENASIKEEMKKACSAPYQAWNYDRDRNAYWHGQGLRLAAGNALWGGCS